MKGKQRRQKGTGVHISVEGDVRGNIIIGDENIVEPPKRGSRIRWWGAAAALLIAALAFAISNDFLARLRNSSQPPILPSPNTTTLPPGVWRVEVFGSPDLSGSVLVTFSLPAGETENGYRTIVTAELLQEQVVLSSAYSLRLRGVFPFTEGEYAFHCLHYDGCRVFVGDENWIDAWWDGAGQHDLARPLAGGKHPVVVEFYDKSGAGKLEIWWEQR